MSIAQETSHYSHTKRRQQAQNEYRVIFALCFVVFLIALVPVRMSRWIARPLDPASRNKQSLFAEAREAANAALPYAFIG